MSSLVATLPWWDAPQVLGLPAGLVEIEGEHSSVPAPTRLPGSPIRSRCRAQVEVWGLGA